jgi:hypothetical protein
LGLSSVCLSVGLSFYLNSDSISNALTSPPILGREFVGCHFVVVSNSSTEVTSAGTIPRIDSGRFDSFGDFCGRARRLELKVKESIQARYESQTKIIKKSKPFKLKFAEKASMKPKFFQLFHISFEDGPQIAFCPMP